MLRMGLKLANYRTKKESSKDYNTSKVDTK
jgi:hypothetical protein